MKLIPWQVITATVLLLLSGPSFAEIEVVVDRNDNEHAHSGFKFKGVSAPSNTDVATRAKFIVLDGDPDANGGSLLKLHDGRVPTEPDEPAESFFFDAGTPGGRILVDLGSAFDLKQINTYSWHPGDRGPQLYTLYAAEDKLEALDLRPERRAEPEKCGWKLISRIDTRPKQGEPGGQYGVSISDSEGSIGKYRYLLFDLSRTEAGNDFGNTFYSEIDVCDKNGTTNSRPLEPSESASAPFIIHSPDGACDISINTTDASELKVWAEQKLGPFLAEWYPKLVAMLPSEGFTPPKQFSVTIRPGRGVAATGGTRITANSAWLKAELDREAIGALLHEEVHVLQQYRGRRNNPDATRAPGWLVEGIPDYIRWFKYEPQSHGADVVWLRTRRNLALNYDAGYRITANFLDYVVVHYDQAQTLVRRVNAACRLGKYTDELWKECTGKTLAELNEEWKTDVQKQLNAEGAASAPAAAANTKARE